MKITITTEAMKEIEEGKGHKVDSVDELIKDLESDVEVVKGKVVEEPKPNILYLALYQVTGVIGWLISGVIYHRIDEVKPNLAAFNPTKILTVEVEMPVEE